MHDLLSDLDRWRQTGQPVAIATVVRVYGSAPRPLGAKMAVSVQGEMAGSVSGGCVEGAVAQEALGVLAAGTPKLLEYGIADELAMSVGLACGGNIEVFVAPLSPALHDAWQEAVAYRRPLALVTVLRGPQTGSRAWWTPDGWQNLEALPVPLAQLEQLRQEALARQQPSRVEVETAGGPVDLFLDLYLPPARLIVVGAVHTAIPLVSIARTLGFHTIVLDARSAFATPERFGHADQLIVRWPADALADLGLDSSTYLVLLTHDPKIDNPVLAHALPSPARYIGALGSRKTHARRLQELQELGVDPALLARIHAPIGLDLGGRQPEEIALAIMAEIVAVRNGRSLRELVPATA
ncbi:MAG TPA: XdhC/CoxI family protein [Caldilineaceae bacterium]|nr:XdhC/CoxI family protein [Caldilineaceae bacterium]